MHGWKVPAEMTVSVFGQRERKLTELALIEDHCAVRMAVWSSLDHTSSSEEHAVFSWFFFPHFLSFQEHFCHVDMSSPWRSSESEILLFFFLASPIIVTFLEKLNTVCVGLKMRFGYFRKVGLLPNSKGLLLWPFDFMWEFGSHEAGTRPMCLHSWWLN